MSETVSDVSAGPDAVRERRRIADGGLAIARLRDLALIPAIIAIAIVGQFVNPVFLHTDNLLNVLQTMSEIAILVLAETLVLIAGKMDLSLESTFGLAPGIAAWLTVQPGVTHGLGVGARRLGHPSHTARRRAGRRVQRAADRPVQAQRLHRHPGHADRGTRAADRHLRRPYLLRPARLDALPEQHQVVRRCRPRSGSACSPSRSAIAVLGFTRSGRALYAIGGNVDAARAAGIRTDRVLWLTLIVASTLAALGGLLLSGRLASVAASQGNGDIFTVFAAAVIGGVSLNGGKGSMFGAFTGVLLLFMIQNVLTLGGRTGPVDLRAQRRDHPDRADGLPDHQREGAGLTAGAVTPACG